MGGLRRVTLLDAMEILQSKKLQQYLYFKKGKLYSRVIDYEWALNHNKGPSLINQEFYIELDADIKKEEENDRINIELSEDMVRDITNINIQIKVPIMDLNRDQEELMEDLLDVVKHHLVLQIDNWKGEK